MPRESTELHRTRLNGFHAHNNGVNINCPVGNTWFTFTHKDYDILGEYNVAIAGEFVCQREGVYLVVAKMHATGLIGAGNITLMLDGVGFGVDYGMDSRDIPAAPTGNWGFEIVLLKWINIGERIRMGVNNAMLAAFNALGGENDTFFSVQRLTRAE